MSLIPFATSWLGENFASPVPTAFYGFCLLMPGLAWYVMQSAIIRAQGAASPLAEAIGRDIKGKLAPPLYIAGIACAFLKPWIADLLYAGVALMWLVPDRRIETRIAQE